MTHATELHASVILWNLFSPIKRKISYDDLSWVTFTDPEVATFGLSEPELRNRGVRYRKVVQGFEDVNRATTDDYPESKLIVYLKGEQILGGTMVAATPVSSSRSWFSPSKTGSRSASCSKKYIPIRRRPASTAGWPFGNTTGK